MSYIYWEIFSQAGFGCLAENKRRVGSKLDFITTEEAASILFTFINWKGQEHSDKKTATIEHQLRFKIVRLVTLVRNVDKIKNLEFDLNLNFWQFFLENLV